MAEQDLTKHEQDLQKYERELEKVADVMIEIHIVYGDEYTQLDLIPAISTQLCLVDRFSDVINIFQRTFRIPSTVKRAKYRPDRPIDLAHDAWDVSVRVPTGPDSWNRVKRYLTASNGFIPANRKIWTLGILKDIQTNKDRIESGWPLVTIDIRIDTNVADAWNQRNSDGVP